MAPISFSHIAINCADPIRTESFYCRHFGFQRSRVYLPGEHQVVMIRLGDAQLELFPANGSAPIPRPEKDGYEFAGVRHICLQVHDLDAVLAAMGEEAQISLGPLDMGQFIPGMRAVWLHDPDGNIVELNEGYRDELDPPAFDPTLRVT